MNTNARNQMADLASDHDQTIRRDMHQLADKLRHVNNDPIFRAVTFTHRHPVVQARHISDIKIVEKDRPDENGRMVMSSIAIVSFSDDSTAEYVNIPTFRNENKKDKRMMAQVELGYNKNRIPGTTGSHIIQPFVKVIQTGNWLVFTPDLLPEVVSHRIFMAKYTPMMNQNTQDEGLTAEQPRQAEVSPSILDPYSE